MKRIKLFVILVFLLVLIVCLLIRTDILFIRGEQQLSQSFIEEFDLSKLDPLEVYNYLEENGGYHVLSHYMSEKDCRFSIPPEGQCWVNEVILEEGAYEVELPTYRLKWYFQLPPKSEININTKNNEHFERRSKSFFVGEVHIFMTGGSVDMFVCGNSIQQCQDIAEDKLLDIYRNLLQMTGGN